MTSLPERLEQLSAVARNDAEARRMRIEQTEETVRALLDDLNREKLDLEAKYGLEPRATRIDIPKGVKPVLVETDQ